MLAGHTTVTLKKVFCWSSDLGLVEVTYLRVEIMSNFIIVEVGGAKHCNFCILVT